MAGNPFTARTNAKSTSVLFGTCTAPDNATIATMIRNIHAKC